MAPSLLPPSLPPVSARWACKLIRRDVKNWFRPAKVVSQPPLQPRAEEAVTREPERPRTVAVQSEQEGSCPVSSEFNKFEEGGCQQRSTSMYELLIASLKDVYASRDRYAEHEDRWRFRGSWLVLHMAALACPSNPIYDIFRPEKLNETAVLTDILKQCLSAAAASGVPAQPASALPAAPYSNAINEHIRKDSVLSTVSFLTPHDQGRTTAQWWLTVLEGATDKTKTIAAAEALIAHVWCGESPASIIRKLGDPSEHFDKEDQLRISIRDYLFPGYYDLVRPRTGEALWAEA